MKVSLWEQHPLQFGYAVLCKTGVKVNRLENHYFLCCDLRTRLTAKIELELVCVGGSVGGRFALLLFGRLASVASH